MLGIVLTGLPDFTVNAIAVSEEGHWTDPSNGRKDAEIRVLRAVGYTNERFREDPSRMLRALRLSVTCDLGLDSQVEGAL